MKGSSQNPDSTGAKNVFRSGYVAIVGAPNVGKSTLLNKILGEKIAIATPKPQTTRDNIVGIKHLDDAQIVFVDTPGIHQARSKLNKAMVRSALSILEDVDVVLLVVDVANQIHYGAGTIGPGDMRVVELLRAAGLTSILVLNKVDVVRKDQVLPVIDVWQEQLEWSAIIPISALSGLGVDEAVTEVVRHLGEGPRFFDDDMVTDRSTRFIAAEFVREKLFLQLGEELPYSVAVEVEQWEEKKKEVRIHAVIHVEKESQKRIVVGAGGNRIKEVGIAARQTLETFLNKHVYLKLFVHVESQWTRSDRKLREFGYQHTVQEPSGEEDAT